jgi:hypothetical protein
MDSVNYHLMYSTPGSSLNLFEININKSHSSTIALDYEDLASNPKWVEDSSTKTNAFFIKLFQNEPSRIVLINKKLEAFLHKRKLSEIIINGTESTKTITTVKESPETVNKQKSVKVLESAYPATVFEFESPQNTRELTITYDYSDSNIRYSEACFFYKNRKIINSALGKNAPTTIEWKKIPLWTSFLAWMGFKSYREKVYEIVQKSFMKSTNSFVNHPLIEY